MQSWSTGFGVPEVVALLEQETGRGVIFADTQWGNPRTALELYARRHFPHLRIVPISREFLDPAETRRRVRDARRLAPVRYAIFSADRSGARAEWLRQVESEMCVSRQEVRGVGAQMPIVVCRF